MKTRKMRIRDLKTLDFLHQSYFEESNFADVAKFNGKKYRKVIFSSHVFDKNFHGIVVENYYGTVVGYAYLQFESAFTDALIGDVYQFYIHPTYRGTVAARSLRDACVAEFDRRGCVFSYTGCASGLGDQNAKAYLNLWAKAGYEHLGPELVRKVKNVELI